MRTYTVGNNFFQHATTMGNRQVANPMFSVRGNKVKGVISSNYRDAAFPTTTSDQIASDGPPLNRAPHQIPTTIFPPWIEEPFTSDHTLSGERKT